MKIPLFDIDWTLLKGGNKAHMDSFGYAIGKEFDRRVSIYDVEYHGKIDNQIIMEISNLHDIPQEEAKRRLPQVVAHMGEYFKAHEDEGEHVPLPGVVEILNLLKSKNVPLGLLTGNVQYNALRKLEKAGIGDFFHFGAFGDQAEKRVELIEIAKREAESALNRPVRREEFVIIGDSPLDVACAKEGGIASIAVASGAYSESDLSAVGADLVVSSLEEKDKIFEFLQVQ